MLVVRNGMPYLKDAIESVRKLSYANYELVIQDGASTDGTLEFLKGLTDARIHLVSEPDSGIGQGFNRALKRCRGDIIGSIDADNALLPDAVDIAVREFAAHPNAAVVYGGCRMIDANGTFIHSWMAPEFDLLRLIDGEVVPPFASSFFSRRGCGDELRFDESMPTVADFDLWLRIADRPIYRTLENVCDVRASSKSSTWRPEAYEAHCSHKIQALRRFFSGKGQTVLLDHIRQRAEGGLHLWAVDSLGTIGGSQEQIDKYFQFAGDADLRTDRFRRIVGNVKIPRPATSCGLEKRVFECGIEYFVKHRPDEALVYFELLKSWNYEEPALDDWLSRARKLSDDLLRIRCQQLADRSTRNR
jgi:hypothetical protein